MRKDFVIQIITVLSVLLFASCEKQTLEVSEPNSPYFKFEAVLNGQAIAHRAGENDCYANTYYSISGSDSLLTFNFVLDNLNDYTKRYLKLTINNFKIPYGNQISDKDSTITLGSYDYHYFNVKPGNPNHLKEVSLIWYNENRESFYTYSTSQTYSRFLIKSIKDTVVSLRFVPTKVKIAEIEFRCRLKNTFTGDTINVTNGFIRAIF